VSTTQLVRDAFEAFSSGDLEALAAAFAPDAKWRAVEDGPWNCHSRDEILARMRENRANGVSGRVEGLTEEGNRAIVAFRPDAQGARQWPHDDGVRYLVLTFRDGLIIEMKGCADRAAAVAYARR
jgi:ketosteroid isomerase-like protein